jgi:hypothetical protein
VSDRLVSDERTPSSSRIVGGRCPIAADANRSTSRFVRNWTRRFDTVSTISNKSISHCEAEIICLELCKYTVQNLHISRFDAAKIPPIKSGDCTELSIKKMTQINNN